MFFYQVECRVSRQDNDLNVKIFIFYKTLFGEGMNSPMLTRKLINVLFLRNVRFVEGMRGRAQRIFSLEKSSARHFLRFPSTLIIYQICPPGFGSLVINCVTRRQTFITPAVQ